MKISPRIWKRVLWLLAVGAVLALIARHLTASEEWRAFRWDHLWKIFRQVYLGFLLAAVAVSLSTYLLRALRWRSFLEHIVHVPLKTLVAGQFIGFSTVYLIGRAGELVRPAYVARRGGVPFVSMAAVWLLERVYDSVFIFLILGLGLSLGGIDPTRPQDSAFIRALEISSRGLLFLLLILIVGLIYFQMKAEGAISHLSSSKPIPLLSERRKKWLLGVAESFSIGLGTIGKGQVLLSSLGYSILVWTANVSVFWLVAQGLGGGADRLTWYGTFIAVFSSVLGLTVQVPGIGGGFQVAVAITLKEIVGLEPVAATAVALLTWVVIMVPATLVGAVWMFREGLSYGKLRHWAEEKETLSEDRQARVG